MLPQCPCTRSLFFPHTVGAMFLSSLSHCLWSFPIHAHVQVLVRQIYGMNDWVELQVSNKETVVVWKRKECCVVLKKRHVKIESMSASMSKVWRQTPAGIQPLKCRVRQLQGMCWRHLTTPICPPSFPSPFSSYLMLGLTLFMLLLLWVTWQPVNRCTGPGSIQAAAKSWPAF